MKTLKDLVNRNSIDSTKLAFDLKQSAKEWIKELEKEVLKLKPKPKGREN